MMVFINRGMDRREIPALRSDLGFSQLVPKITLRNGLRELIADASCVKVILLGNDFLLSRRYS